MAAKKKTKRCDHRIASQFTWRPGPGVVTRRCTCGALLAIGPANDQPAAVKIEIRAARIAGRGKLPGKWSESLGWAVHAEAADVAVDHDLAKPAGEWAGWLARELSTHDDRATRDADAPEWDMTRPIAEQPSVVEFDVRVGEEPELGEEVPVEVDSIYSRTSETTDVSVDRDADYRDAGGAL